jgi:resuscitation-promoting factor RpfA
VGAIDSAIGPAATWAATAVGGYLALGLVATLLARCAGATGGVGGVVLLLYPRVARKAMRVAVAAAVGLGATVGSGGAVAEAGAPRPPVPPLVAPATPAAEPLDWPVGRPDPPAAATAHRPARAPQADVVVRPGDCLWRVAARSLGRAATPSATAAAWPRWWAANRAAIGDNPDLLRPGLQLRAPRTLERNGR